MQPNLLVLKNLVPFTIQFIKGKKHIVMEINSASLADWVDKQDLQVNLHISDRTLYTLRKTGRIPYAALGGKFYYFLPGMLNIFVENVIANAAK